MQEGVKLPRPFGCTGVLPPNEVQTVLYPRGDGQFNLLKWADHVHRSVDVCFSKEDPVDHAIYMVTHLLATRELVVSEPSTKWTRSDTQIDAGYDFINTKGPISTAQNEHMDRADKKTRDEAALARVTSLYGPCQRTKYSGHCQEDLDIPIDPQGYEPLGSAELDTAHPAKDETDCNTFCRSNRHAEDTIANLDFVRSEPGQVHMLFVLADADKVFCDSSGEGVKAHARWNAASFSQFQP
eukprot:2971666-Amphidinium_carterae.1